METLHQDFHPRGAARADRGDNHFIHGELGTIPLSARAHDVQRAAGAAGRRHYVVDQGRRVQLGADHDRCAARCRESPLIIYAFLTDYYIAGLTAGATKG